MPQNAFFLRTCDLLASQKTMQRHFFSTLHPLFAVIFATATVLAFVLLHDSRFNFHCYTQREAMPAKKSARKCAATSCAKDYKALSLLQTSFAESPNRSRPAGVAQSRHSFVGGTVIPVNKKAEKASEMPIKHSLLAGNVQIGL